MTCHRFERIVNGRVYLIEVTVVDPGRWRAFLTSGTGGPTAMMPFYGETPEDAAQQLTDWLTLAHKSATLPV